jgi:hypothetical protein
VTAPTTSSKPLVTESFNLDPYTGHDLALPNDCQCYFRRVRVGYCAVRYGSVAVPHNVLKTANLDRPVGR